jgi:hypothetical protein
MTSDSIKSLTKQRKNLFSQYVCDMKKVDESIAKSVIHRHNEDQFIKSWSKMVGNPSNRLVVSKPAQGKFFDDCKALVNSIKEIRLAQKTKDIKKTAHIQLQNIQKIDEEIRKLKIQQRQGDEY